MVNEIQIGSIVKINDAKKSGLSDRFLNLMGIVYGITPEKIGIGATCYVVIFIDNYHSSFWFYLSSVELVEV